MFNFKSVGRILASLLVLTMLWAFSPIPTQAANNMTVTFTPTNNQGNVAVGSNIVATFSANISAGSIDDTTFRVDGSFSGLIAGAYNTTNKIVTFNPTNNFYPGETVMVTLTSGIKSAGNDTLIRPWAWQFQVAAASVTPSFHTRLAFTSAATYVPALAFGDVNGDRILDLVMDKYQSQSLVFMGDGDGTFDTTSHLFGAANAATTAIALGDVNGDGNLDIVAVAASEQGVVYMGNGNGTFNTYVYPFGPSDQYTDAVALGDVNGDGALDIVVAEGSHGAVYLNNGDGTDWSTKQSLNLNQAISVTLADMNSDGFLDIVAGGFPSQVVLNDGDGTFDTTAYDFAIDDEALCSTALGDLNNDGHLDIVVGNTEQQSMVYFNDGTDINWSYTEGFGDGTNTFPNVFLADMNGDGRLDIVEPNDGGQNLVYLNYASGSHWVNTLPFGTGSDETRYAAMADLDSDGDLDIAAANYGGEIDVYLNNPPITVTTKSPDNNQSNVSRTSNITATFNLNINSGSVNSSTFIVNGSVSGRMAGSYSTSGQQVTFNPTDSFQPGESLTVTLTTGIRSTPAGYILAKPLTWQFSAVAPSGTAVFPQGGQGFGTGSDDTVAVAFGDVNGDKILDMAVGNYKQQSLVYIGDGDGSFDTTSHLFGGSNDATTAIALGDVNADGRLDIVQGVEGNNDKVYLGDGDGTFDTQIYSFNQGDGGFPASIALGDLNGDGALDIAVGDGWPSMTFLNNGDGTDWSNYAYTDLNPTTSIALADINGDGLLDLVAGGFPSQVLLNNGNGIFFNTTSYGFATGDANLCSTALGDLNNDGHLDIVVGNDGQQSVVYLNDGTDTDWSDAHPFGIISNDWINFALGDMNGDGRLDIVAGYKNGQNLVYINDGSGTDWSTTQPFGTGSDATTALALADVDSDGDLDIAVGNFGGEPNVLYYNQNGASNPVISVLGKGIEIANGDLSPRLADDTDFGSTTQNATVTRTFTIHNSGNADLHLTGNPTVNFTAKTAFSITDFPVSPIAPGNIDTFTIVFSAQDEGDSYATVTIANDDTERNPYTFRIKGTVTSSGGGNGGRTVGGEFTPISKVNGLWPYLLAILVAGILGTAIVLKIRKRV